MIRCNKKQTCNYSWTSMRVTRGEDIRFCPQCQQAVYWVNNYVEFKNAAQKNQCIAFEPANVLMAAQRTQPPIQQCKQFLILAQQKLSLKQLTHIKKYIHPDWSLRRLRDNYHNKYSVIKFDVDKAETDRVIKVLQGLNINIEVRREVTV